MFAADTRYPSDVPSIAGVLAADALRRGHETLDGVWAGLGWGRAAADPKSASSQTLPTAYRAAA